MSRRSIRPFRCCFTLMAVAAPAKTDPLGVFAESTVGVCSTKSLANFATMGPDTSAPRKSKREFFCKHRSKACSAVRRAGEPVDLKGERGEVTVFGSGAFGSGVKGLNRPVLRARRGDPSWRCSCMQWRLRSRADSTVSASQTMSSPSLLAGPTSLARGDVLTAPSALACCPASKVGGDGVCGTMRGRTLILALSTRVAGVLTCPGTPGLQFCGARRFRGGVLKVCNSPLVCRARFTGFFVLIGCLTPTFGFSRAFIFVLALLSLAEDFSST